jgi:hypothetical protein
MVPPDQKLDSAVAQIADSIEKHDNVRISFLDHGSGGWFLCGSDILWKDRLQ